MEQKVVLDRIESDALILTLNRAEKKNALTREMYKMLDESLQAAEQNSSVRSVVIEGAGGAFTSGNDLKDFMESKTFGPDSPVLGFLRTLSTFSKPLIASVEGCAVGIGTTLLLHCDFIFANKTAYFQTPFINLGLCPEGASSLLMPLKCGHHNAAKMLLLGEKISADEALTMGLISEICGEQPLTEAMACAEKIRRLPPAALAVSKRLLKDPLRKQTLDVIEVEAEEFAERLLSAEAKEAFSAFFEKRAPKWTAS